MRAVTGASLSMLASVLTALWACTPAPSTTTTTTTAAASRTVTSGPGGSAAATSSEAAASAVVPLAVGSGAVPASSVGPVPDCTKVKGQEAVEVEVPAVDGRMMNNASSDASVDVGYAELGAVVVRRLGALRCCYAAARERRPDLAGRLVLDIELEGDGRVRSVSPRGEKSDINDELMTGCVVATERELVFPASRRGRPTRVTLPIVFRPREAR